MCVCVACVCVCVACVMQLFREPVCQLYNFNYIAGNNVAYVMNVMQVSIIPRTNKMLGFAQYMPEERKLLSEDAVSVFVNSLLNF